MGGLHDNLDSYENKGIFKPYLRSRQQQQQQQKVNKSKHHNIIFSN
jgi:hypothetical protein